MSINVDIALLGATGVVGETVLQILAERKFPMGKVHLLASGRSAGSTALFKKKNIVIKDAETFDFSQVQLCFSAVNADIAATYVPRATDAGCVVIDKSSQFRYENDVPLVIPEVNADAIADYRERNIIAVPNCSTIQLLVALKPIYDAVGIARINIATYQSVSGSGKDGIEALSQQVTQLLNGHGIAHSFYPQQIAFNVLPYIDGFLDNGYTKEEMKLVWETRKIFKDNEIAVNPTAVRVPVFYGHAEAVYIETQQKISAEQVRVLLHQAPGVIVIDEPQNPAGYPTPTSVIHKEDAVYVGRIREDISYPNGINLWIVADNVRKGAALTAVQIAELLVRDYF